MIELNADTAAAPELPMTSLDPKRIGERLRNAKLHSGLGVWAVRAHGPAGWVFISPDRYTSVIVSCADFGAGEIVHASIARSASSTVDYADMVALHRAVWGTCGYAYQQFVPAEHHVNIHPNCLHLFGRSDGKPIAGLPVITGGTI